MHLCAVLYDVLNSECLNSSFSVLCRCHRRVFFHSLRVFVVKIVIFAINNVLQTVAYCVCDTAVEMVGH